MLKLTGSDSRYIAKRQLPRVNRLALGIGSLFTLALLLLVRVQGPAIAAPHTSFTLPLLTSTPVVTLTSDIPTLTVTSIITPTSTVACTPFWNQVPSPNVDTSNNTLSSVAAVSWGDSWTVGAYNDTASGAKRTLIEHWDGSVWSVVASPNTGTGNNVLHSAVAVSANDIWAVGLYNDGSAERTLIEHWDGSAWGVVSSPNMGSGSNYLNGVTALSPTDVWAAGYACLSSDCQPPADARSLLMHWDGSSWSIISSPNLQNQNNYLWAVAGSSSNDVWAVGQHNSCYGCATRTLILHWDGVQWSIVDSPSPGSSTNSLYGVTVLSSSDAWAVGHYYDPTNGLWRTMTLHWDGTLWSVVASPNAGQNVSNYLQSVTAISPNDIWTVGGRSDSGSLTLHWDGTMWNVVENPASNSGTNRLYGVSALSTDYIWAVGANSDSVDHTLTQLYSDPCATPVPTFTPPATNTPASTNTPDGPTFTPSSTVTSTPIPTDTVMDTSTPTVVVFSDVQQTDYFYEPVHYLNALGAVSGYADDTFRPYNFTTRGQLSKIVVNAEGWVIDTADGPHFTDVLPGSTFYDVVETAYNHHIISGYADGTFHPDSEATRGQISKIVVNAEGWAIDSSGGPHFTDVLPGDTFYDVIETAYNHHIVSGYADNTFRPSNNATRGQISKIVYNAITQP